MARTVPIVFTSTVRRTSDPARVFWIDTDGLRVSVHGYLSTGTRGWRLSARVAKRRSTVTIRIRAIEGDVQRIPDLEHHEYEATVRLSGPGVYSIRVIHEFVLQGASAAAGMPHAVFERLTSVPGVSSSPIPESPVPGSPSPVSGSPL